MKIGNYEVVRGEKTGAWCEVFGDKKYQIHGNLVCCVLDELEETQRKLAVREKAIDDLLEEIQSLMAGIDGIAVPQ